MDCMPFLLCSVLHFYQQHLFSCFKVFPYIKFATTHVERSGSSRLMKHCITPLRHFKSARKVLVQLVVKEVLGVNRPIYLGYLER